MGMSIVLSTQYCQNDYLCEKTYWPLLKDYDHQIIWLDYFNKNLSRKKGRKVGKNMSRIDPTAGAYCRIKKLELDFSEEETNNQLVPTKSFCKIRIYYDFKKSKKSAIINQIAKMMIETRQQKH